MVVVCAVVRQTNEKMATTKVENRIFERCINGRLEFEYATRNIKQFEDLCFEHECRPGEDEKRR